MAVSFRSRFLGILSATEGRITALFRDLAAGIAGDVARLADSAGAVPRSATPEIQRLSAERVARLFLGRNRAGELAPFELTANGRVVALAPYPAALWAGITAAVRLPIEQSAGILEKYTPADVLATLRQAKGNPFTAAKRRVVEEMAPIRGGALVAEFTQIELFQPNVLAAYDPPHLWVDPNGYRLSDRVWDNSQAVRQKIDLYVADAIKQGIGATEMAKGLEQFLTPGYGQIKTKKPYGTTASYGAMRLARTEITRAHSEAQKVSAAANPFIAALKWHLSASHPRVDICDEYARGGPQNNGVYPVTQLPEIPHPHCVTPGQLVTTLRGDVPIEDVAVGDWVLTHRGRYRPVLAAWATPHNGLVYRFETSEGTFELTGNHPVLLASGWVNAEFLQPGNEVLYTGIGVTGDGCLTEALDAPTSRGEKSGAASVALFNVGPIVPAAITFDPDLERRHSNINKEFSNLEFHLVGNTSHIKGQVYGGFQWAGIGQSQISTPQQHWHKSRVIQALGSGDLARYLRTLGRVVVAKIVQPTIDVFKHLRSRLASAPIVLLPASGYGFAHITHRDSAHGQQVAQNAIGDPILGVDGGARQPSLDVSRVEQFGNGHPVFAFQPQGVQLGSVDTMALGVPSKIGHSEAANGASQHNSLLTLSPDAQWGAGSGNPVVGEVANPTQAPLYYTKILAVTVCQYAGNVYNMTVADDHSYTVNRAVTHNCLCYRTNVMVSDPDAVIEALRRDVRQARADLIGLVGPAAVEDFEMLLLGGQGPLSAPTPAGIVRRVTPPPPPPTPTPAAPPPMAGLDDPTMTLVWGKDPEGAGQLLNGVALEPADGTEYWLDWKDKKLKGEPKLPTGQRISTGVVIVEPDGRIWIVEPAGHYGGYEHTFPKGGLEPNLSAQQNALKELYEESGLTAELTGYLGDFQGSTGVSRYYIAKRTGGAPWRSDWETATVKLAPQDKAAQLLNTKRDKEILATLQAKLAPKPKKPRAPRKPKAPAPPPAAPAPLPTSAAGDEIPGLDQLAFVKKLGGSTGAQLFEDKSGKRYVVKGGNSEEHIKSEYLADELYRALGANVPRARLVQKGGKTYKIAEYIDGKLLNELSGQALANAHAELQKHFAADALLASWDVIGLGADNVIVDAAGKAWRIDNGGSLLFRAQGAPKAMGNYLDELWTLRDKAVNAQTHKVFGDASYGDIANQLSAIVSQRSVIMSKVTDPALRRILDARLNHAADLAGIYRTFHDDNYIDSYIDRFSYHNTWIQSLGVTSTLPQRLTQKATTSSNVILLDENGKEFDDLRGSGGIYAKFLKELDARTGKKGKEFVQRWANAQAGDSWSPLSRLVKQRMMVNRPSSSYYWKDTDSFTESALAHFRTLYSDSAVDDMAAALNALSYETLRKVEVGKRPAPGVLSLLRTESDYVIDRYGMQRKKGSTAMIERGALESTSLLKPVVVMGGNLTEQDIPIHRVMGFYGFGVDKTMYLNDRENELLVLLDGYESRYGRKIKR